MASDYDAAEARRRGAILRERRKHLRGSDGRTMRQLEFADEAGITQGYLSELETGRKDLARAEEKTKRRLAEALSLSPAQFFEVFGVRVSLHEPDRTASLEPALDRTPATGPAVLPVFAAGCGPAFLIDEALRDEPAPLRIPPGVRAVLLEARGNSMEPDVYEGDVATVYVDDGLAEVGDLVAVAIPEVGVVLKWLVADGEELVLESSNPPRDQPARFTAPAGSKVSGPVMRLCRGKRPRKRWDRA